MKSIVPLVFCAACCAQTITIVNSGSTNTAGFQIVVEKSGDAEYTSQPRRGPDKNPKKMQKTIPKALTDRLFADVQAARPLSSLPARHCVKSASFGTRLNIEFDGEQTPDLSCGDGGNEQLKALIADANEIIKLFQSQ